MAHSTKVGDHAHRLDSSRMAGGGAWSSMDAPPHSTSTISQNVR